MVCTPSLCFPPLLLQPLMSTSCPPTALSQMSLIFIKFRSLFILGWVGLQGQNLILNMNDHGFVVRRNDFPSPSPQPNKIPIISSSNSHILEPPPIFILIHFHTHTLTHPHAHTHCQCLIILISTYDFMS